MFTKILKYDEFLKEALSVNNDVKSFSDFLFNFLKDKPVGLYKIYDNIPEIFNASEIIISIVKYNGIYNGELDVNKSKIKNGKWIYYLNIVEYSNIGVYYHELNHILQLSKKGKYKTIKDINHINSFKTSNSSLRFKDIFFDFCEIIYYASDMEIDSKVIQTYGDIKDFFNKYHENKNINNDMFIHYMKQTDGWDISLKLINFKLDSIDDVSILNKFLCYAEKIKNDLDKTKIDSKLNQSNKLAVILKSFWYAFNTSKYDENQKPKHDLKYYEKYINSQGVKLQHKLMKLYGHFDIKSDANFKDSKI